MIILLCLCLCSINTGNAQGKYQRENLLGPLNDYLLQRLQPFVISVPVARTSFSIGKDLL